MPQAITAATNEHDSKRSWTFLEIPRIVTGVTVCPGKYFEDDMPTCAQISHSPTMSNHGVMQFIPHLLLQGVLHPSLGAGARARRVTGLDGPGSQCDPVQTFL